MKKQRFDFEMGDILRGSFSEQLPEVVSTYLTVKGRLEVEGYTVEPSTSVAIKPLGDLPGVILVHGGRDAKKAFERHSRDTYLEYAYAWLAEVEE